MKLEIKDIINKHKNKSAIIIAHGPSLNEYKNKLITYKEKGYIIFDCNEWFCFHDTIPHYWVVANNQFTIKKEHETINKYSSVFLYADSVDVTERSFVEDHLKGEYLPYDQRHFHSQSCESEKCCKHIIKGRLTIQEELKKYTGHDTLYSSGSTVALHMITFAILMGCNPIYIIGIDLDYNLGYASFKGRIAVPSPFYNQYSKGVIKDLKIINNSSKNIPINIINLNKNSTFNVIETGEL